ncbi:unnamed protein product [Cylindrotheca closterium]|uniref:Uncharacterized protein n=1 Tax=Cylindrotheca closterium TaxID=2856 RepID=A0AAD2FT71_9STRA|nr:unnamed protein product [Cylindrotheca closterium]
MEFKNTKKKRFPSSSDEELATPEKVESWPRAVTESPKKRPKHHGDENQKAVSGRVKEENTTTSTEGTSHVERKPRPDSVKKYLLSELDAANDSTKEGDHTKVAATGETKMGFGRKHRDKTYREVVTKDQEYARWAKNERRHKGVSGPLSKFMEWLDSPEGQNIEEGNQQFTYGTYHGKSFNQIAESDPSYHVRYRKALEKKGKKPGEQLTRYISWYKKAIGADPKIISYPRKSGDNQRFTFGQHKGATFLEVARGDPSYHLRYMAMDPNVRSKRNEFNAYVEYFESNWDSCDYEAYRGGHDDWNPNFAGGIIY